MKDGSKLSIQTKILLLLVLSTFIMSIGYATLNGVALNIMGTASVADDGVVSITNISVSSSSNVVENTAATINNDGSGINFDLSVTVDSSNYNQDFYITYLIDIKNDSITDQRVLATNFTPTFTGNGTPPTATYSITDSDNNQMANDIIPAKTTKSYYLTITFHPSETGSWGVGGETSVTTGDVDTGTVIGAISGSTQGDLTGNNTLAHFTASVINSHDTSRNFTLSVDSTKFQIVDQNGNSLSSMNVNANTTSTYDFYIKIANGSKFMTSPQNLNIYLTCDGETQSMGTVSLLVDIDPTLSDFEAPIISNVTATTVSTDKTIHVSWNATDANTITDIYLEVYSADSAGNGTFITKYTLAGTDRSKDVTVPTGDAYYFFKVYGKDQSKNTASSNEISSCGTNSGHCSSSANKKFKWYFTVVLKLENAKADKGTSSTNGSTTTVTFSNVMYDSNVESITLSGNGSGYNPPTGIKSATITYPGDTSASSLPSGSSSQTAYSYSSNVLNVYHVTGDVAISADGDYQCLPEGTDILLADGSYKKIEDIGYDDLLAVWNYDTGSITYEYPIWMEHEHVGKEFTRVTFEDDTYIEFYNNHSVYSTDINLFVNIFDTENFHVGTNIAKIDKDQKLVSARVKKIEKVHKEAKYYFIGTTTYFNLIANDVLTTDRNVMLSNLYGFEDNAKWPKEKEAIVADESNLLDYSYVSDVVPYYLFEGFRAKEVGFLIKMGAITLDQFRYYLVTCISNPSMLKPPINRNGSNYWMVTTSLDKVENKEDFLQKEGSVYELPFIDNVKGWLNTANNKVYLPGDKVSVLHGMHFIAIY